MTPRAVTTPGYRIERSLSEHSTDGYLVRELGVRQKRWVLRWLAPVSELDTRLPSNGIVPRRELLDFASLRHSQLALPERFGRDQVSGRLFSLRPFIDGSPVLGALDGQPTRTIISCLKSTASAIAVLHHAGFLHNNLKCDNVILTRESMFSRRNQVVLCDARPWSHAAKETCEQGVSSFHHEFHPPTFASDLYSFGAMCFRLLTGRSVTQFVASKPRRYPPPPSKYNPEVPLDVDRVVAKLLAPDPVQRYQNAATVVDDLNVSGPNYGSRLLSPPEVFVGRDSTIAAIRSLLDERSSRTIMVRGEEGVGKSALLRRLSLEAQLSGYRVVTVRCFSDNTVPLAPFRTIAERFIASSPSARALRREFGRLLEASRLNSVTQGKRVHLRGLLQFLRQLSPETPRLLVIDDLHLGDKLTIDLLTEHMKRCRTESSDHPLSVLLSTRSESPFRAPLRKLADALEACREVTFETELDPLPPEDVESWLERTVPGNVRACDITEATRSGSGNPLAVRQSVVALSGKAERLVSSTEDLADLHREYMNSLSRDAREVLVALAVLGRPAPRDLLSAILEMQAEDLAAPLESLLADEALTSERSLIFFRHGSFHNSVAERLAIEAPEKARTHARLAVVLEKRDDTPLEEVAHHWIHSDCPEKGLDVSIRAARKLSRNFADSRALLFYERILSTLRDEQIEIRGVIQEEAAYLHALTGNHRRGVELLEGV